MGGHSFFSSLGTLTNLLNQCFTIGGVITKVKILSRLFLVKVRQKNQNFTEARNLSVIFTKNNGGLRVLDRGTTEAWDPRGQKGMRAQAQAPLWEKGGSSGQHRQFGTLVPPIADNSSPATPGTRLKLKGKGHGALWKSQTLWLPGQNLILSHDPAWRGCHKRQLGGGGSVRYWKYYSNTKQKKKENTSSPPIRCPSLPFKIKYPLSTTKHPHKYSRISELQHQS